MGGGGASAGWEPACPTACLASLVGFVAALHEVYPLASPASAIRVRHQHGRALHSAFEQRFTRIHVPNVAIVISSKGARELAATWGVWLHVDWGPLGNKPELPNYGNSGKQLPQILPQLMMHSAAKFCRVSKSTKYQRPTPTPTQPGITGKPRLPHSGQRGVMFRPGIT